MKYANTLLARLGLTAKPSDKDRFDLRLRRIEQREAKSRVKQALFKNRSTPQAA